ncbi:MAG TPA: hypothetical protein VK548_22450 [Candidatus Acidoferrum sp.]|nr:hypothetical protein [Candidatus Acidoferrum sp.]
MNTSAERAEGTSSHAHLVEAARRFFQENPARILTVASALRAPNRTIESTVLGGSMGATMRAGSRIRIELGRPRRYDPGEVIAFVAGEHVVVHRVVRRARRWPDGYVLTRGDATVLPDQPVGTDRVLGAVTAIQQGGSWVPVECRPRPSLRARVVAPIVLGLVACVLRASPGAAAVLVTLLYRGRLRLAAILGHPGPWGAP